jgi:alkylation response protein AidB-like acyl-CoA dehydrogenase
MDFALSPEQRELSRAVFDFAREQLDDDLMARDSNGVFSRELWQKCAEFGLLGLPIPADYGGQGQDLLTTIVAMEALGRGCRDNGLIFSLNARCGRARCRFCAMAARRRSANGCQSWSQGQPSVRMR